MATDARTYTVALGASPGSTTRQVVTRADSSAGELAAIGVGYAAVIINLDDLSGGAKKSILDGLRAITRRISRDFNTVTVPADLDTVTGSTTE